MAVLNITTMAYYIKLNYENNDDTSQTRKLWSSQSENIDINPPTNTHHEWQQIHHKAPQYHHIDIHGKPETGKAFVINTMECTLNHSFMNISPITYIPISVIIDRCKKKCCSNTMVPLRVCNAITTYKSQGITVGPGKVWEKFVIRLARYHQRKTPGAELVGFSRASDYHMMAISNPLHSINIPSLSKLGQCSACDKRREFENYLIEEHNLLKSTALI